MEDFRGASDLSNVAEEVDTLILSQTPGPQLHEYCENLLADFLKSQANRVIDSPEAIQVNMQYISGYVKELGKILVKKGGWKDDAVPSLHRLLSTMLSSSEAILVVNYDALDEQLIKLLDAVVYCADRSLLRYTALREDRLLTDGGGYYYLYFTDQDNPDRSFF